MKSSLICTVIFFLSLTEVYPQFNDYKYGITANFVYTTSADIFLNPNSSDPVVRNQPFTLEDIINPGIDFRFRFSESVLFGFSTEYISTSKTAPNLTVFLGSQVFRVNVKDGFQLIPFEVTAYYYLPFSTENFKFVMGGGVGTYFGNFTREFADAEALVQKRKFSIGIHVCASMDYLIYQNISARFEMKFRDPQFNVISKYSKTEVEYQGNTITLPDGDFETKINVNGVTFIFGFVYQF